FRSKAHPSRVRLGCPISSNVDRADIASIRCDDALQSLRRGDSGAIRFGSSEALMIEKTRRVVTGFDADGKSIVAIDGPPGSILGGLGEVWVTDGVADNSIKGDLGKRPVILEPPDGGSACRFFTLEPENKTLSASQLEEATAAGFKAMGGEH